MPAQFSWVDQRLVRNRHFDRLDVFAAALYLFLITVADARGLSWYGDNSTARRLSIDEERLRRARDDLVRAGLVAYVRGLYQVLALDDRMPQPPAPPRQSATAGDPAAPSTPAPTTEAVRARIAAMHAALERRP